MECAVISLASNYSEQTKAQPNNKAAIRKVKAMFIAILLLAVWSIVVPVFTLKIGAFNIQVFGSAKANKSNVMNTLAMIAVRYDILLLQEIRDTSGKSVQGLVGLIKQSYGVQFEVKISDRLGRTVSKEEYAFLYRTDRGISVMDSYHFDDGDESTGQDLFEREPFIVRFKASLYKVSDFTLVAIHTSPSKAKEEIAALLQVYEDIKNKWHTTNIIILGDFNAGCSYVSKRAWAEIEIRQKEEFWWPIGDDVDTTTSASDCAYDRFIITGEEMKQSVEPDSVQVFNFGKVYKLTNEQVLEVSDHYPIELVLTDLAPNQHSTGNHNYASGSQHYVKYLWTVLLKLWNEDSEL